MPDKPLTPYERLQRALKKPGTQPVERQARRRVMKNRGVNAAKADRIVNRRVGRGLGVGGAGSEFRRKVASGSAVDYAPEGPLGKGKHKSPSTGNTGPIKPRPGGPKPPPKLPGKPPPKPPLPRGDRKNKGPFKPGRPAPMPDPNRRRPMPAPMPMPVPGPGVPGRVPEPPPGGPPPLKPRLKRPPVRPRT